MFVKFAARSDVGHVRTNNEDNFFCNGIFSETPTSAQGVSEAPCVFAVCDGMGGEDFGEVASLKTVEKLAEHCEKIKFGNYEAVEEFVKAANAAVMTFAKEQNSRAGTTLALVVISEDFFMAYNLGDSRIYVLKEENLLRVTDDHTVAEEKARMGLITPRKAQTSHERHILTKFVGISDDPFVISPDASGPHHVNEVKRVLLCSDGLTEMLTHREISEIVSGNYDVSVSVDKLIEAALERGGKDNVTCVLLEFTNEIQK